MARDERPDRVLVIGLDGATFALLRPWLESGELPCLSRLYREGVSGVLTSVIPPLSPEAWSTFMTGQHPGRHGVMNFVTLRPGSYELCFNTGANVQERTLWRRLSDAGRRVGVVGVPMTYPPEPVNGYLISGLETPGVGAKFTHPASLAEELRREVGGYDLHGDFLGRTTPEGYLARLLHAVDNQAQATCYLLSRYPTDLSVVVIGATDRAQHCFWKFADPRHPHYDPKAPPVLAGALKRVYARVDAAMEKMLGCVPDPKTVIVMSDHGFEPCHRLIHLNCWLERHGYLTSARGSEASYSLAQRTWQSAGRRAPRWLKDWLKARFPALRQHLQSFLMLSRVDWSRTRAFSLNNQHGYIYLHRTDRFPQGLVDPGSEAEALCESLTADLEQFVDARTGEKVVDRVYRVADLHPGPAGNHLPDLVVLWREGYMARAEANEQIGRQCPEALIDSNLHLGDIGRFLSVEQSGAHAPDGILIAHGPGLERRSVEGANIIDLAPTILHLLGEPVPEDMGGRVREELFPLGYLAAHPVRYAAESPARVATRESSYTAEEARQVERHLQDLGYLD